MGNKHHLPAKAQASNTSAPELEQQATAALETRRFRKARDAYKLLCKQDRAKYLPGLIAANRGLAAELTEKGQISEAQQVIAYLKTIAPPAELLGMEVETALQARDWTRATALALELWRAASGAPAPRDRSTMANALVLAFPNTATVGSAWPDKLRAELTAILDAMRAVSESRFDAAQDLLRPLPRASIFAEWKLLVKGWIAFYSGDRAKAGELFALLPEDSRPGQAAAAFQPFLRTTKFPAGSKRDEAIVQACQLMGETALGPIVARAEQLWRNGQYGAAYLELRRAPTFPSEAPDASGALSDFFARILLHLPMRAGDTIVDTFYTLVEDGKFKNAAETRFIHRVLGADAFAAGALREAEVEWEKFVAACPPGELRTNQIASLLLAKLGKAFTQPHHRGILPFNRQHGPDAKNAIRTLRQSIEFDPTNLAAHLDLVQVYEQAKLTSERNRLLDTMDRQFPGNKDVLLQKGRECVERGAYLKGIDALRRAHALDPLDRIVSLELFSAYVELGRERYEKGELDKARQAFEQAESYAASHPFGPRLIRCRRAMLEMLFGDEAVGRQLLDSVRSADDSLAGILMRMHTFHRIYDRAHRLETPVWAELKALPIDTPGARAQLLEAYLMARHGGDRLDWTVEFNFVGEKLAPVLGAAYSRAEALALHAELHKAPGFTAFSSLLIKTALRHDPGDPFFCLLQHLAPTYSPSVADPEKVAAIREEAVRRGDRKAIEFAEFVLKSIPANPFGDAPDPDEFADDGEDEDDTADDFDPDGELDEIQALVLEMSDKEFARFCKSEAKKAPPGLIDALRAYREANRKFAPPKPASPKPPPQNPQLDLF